MQTGANQEPRIGRLRAAWCVLMGQRVTPQQIIADWIEYQQIFNDLLERWSAKLARDVKAEKKRIARLDVPPVVQTPQPTNSKAALRSKVATMRGIGFIPNTPAKGNGHESPSESGAQR